MKVAILSESSADETAVRILIDGLLGKKTEIIPLTVRRRGWPSIQQVLQASLKSLIYNPDVEGFVAVVDSDDSIPHERSHDEQGKARIECRLCQLRKLASQILRNQTRIKTAFGLAVPAIESWLRCGVDPHITEALIIQKMAFQMDALKKQLKRDVYGTDRSSLELKTKCAIEEASRLATMLDDLEKLFPNGFGPLARDVRNW
jgi:hypothetical protein